MWNPQHITVTIGDTVNWSWTGSTFGVKRNVAQVCIVFTVAISYNKKL